MLKSVAGRQVPFNPLRIPGLPIQSRRIGLKTISSIGGKIPELYLYVGHYYWGTNRISRINRTTFVLKDQLDISLASGLYIYDLIKDGTDLYVCDEDDPSNITKVDLNTWSVTSTLSLGTNEEDVRNACIVGTDLYLACRTSPGIVVKVDLTTFTRTSALTLDVGDNRPNDIVSDGTFLYVPCGTSPCKIVKIALATFTRTGVLTLNGAPEYEYYGGKSTVHDGKLYVPCGYQKYAPPPDYVSRLVKVDLATFTREASLSLAITIYDIACCCSQVKDDFIYVSSSGVDRVYKVDLDSFTLSAYLDPSIRSPNCLHIEGDFLYLLNVASDPTGAIIEKIDLSTFTSVDTCISWVDADAIPVYMTS